MKKTSALLASLMMLISMVSCTGEKPAASESASSSSNPSSNVESKETAAFSPAGMAGWNLTAAVQPNFSDGILYFYDDNGSLYAFDTGSKAVKKCADTADGYLSLRVNAIGGKVYGVEAQLLKTGAPGQQMQDNPEPPRFVNIVGDTSFKPIPLTERVSSAFLFQGKLYYSGTEGIQSVDLSTGEPQTLVTASVQNGFLYDDGYLYYQDDYQNDQKHLLYRLKLSAPDQVEVFDMGKEAMPLFVWNGEVFVKDGSVNVGYSEAISKAPWNGTFRPIFKDTEVELFAPYQDGLAALVKNTDGSDTLAQCDTNGTILRDIVPSIGGAGTFVTFTSFGRSLFYQVDNGEGKISASVYIDENGNQNPITLS